MAHEFQLCKVETRKVREIEQTVSQNRQPPLDQMDVGLEGILVVIYPSPRSHNYSITAG